MWRDNLVTGRIRALNSRNVLILNCIIISTPVDNLGGHGGHSDRTLRFCGDSLHVVEGCVLELETVNSGEF